MSMDLPASVLEKIQSNDLRAAVAREAEAPRTVIVELDLPMPKLRTVAPGNRHGTGRACFSFAPAETGPEIGARIADSSRHIAEIIGRPPETFLESSASFVVEATGSQIGQIAEMPAVSAIWPNTQRGR
jgi:hypothetical protein